jgi:hypothetical protein
MKTAVKYNKEANSWQAVNGETHDCGPGKQGRREAMLAALEHDQPELSRIVVDIVRRHDDNPRLLDRLLKGAQLLVKGHVYSTWKEGHYKVRSQSGDETYLVTDVGIPRTYDCNCADFENGLKRRAGLARMAALMWISTAPRSVSTCWPFIWPGSASGSLKMSRSPG